MNRKIATKLSGWNTVDDICKKLGVKRSVAYKYVHYLDEKGFVIQKIKRPRGTMYQISPRPAIAKHFGIYEGTEFVAPEIEFSEEKITEEQKIAVFLSKYKKEHNRRFYDYAVRFTKKISNWKRLYRYLKGYNVVKDFARAYVEARAKIPKTPKIPLRYKKLIGV